jgi:hypothetical protein
MNDEARAELDRILALEPAALTDADRAFLSARRDYLSEDQRTVFGVDEAPATAEETSTEEPEQTRARTRKSQ